MPQKKKGCNFFRRFKAGPSASQRTYSLLWIDHDAVGDTIVAFNMILDRYDLTHLDFRNGSFVPKMRKSNSFSIDANQRLSGRIVSITRLARLRVAAECFGYVIDSGDDAIRGESPERW
jgi:hypothetical protein